jgi:uncharacterized membrane protein YjgN (DUF898 family)
LAFEARIPTLLGMTLLNTLLAVVSFGFYRFWGRTRVRQYLWSQTAVLGDRFEYTGTGGELLRGFARALFVLIPLGLVGGGAYVASSLFMPVLSPAFGVGLYAGSTLVGFAARYSARRYRLSRTRWRGIRGTQVGSPWRFAWLATWTALLTVVTLGLYAPFRRMRLLAYEVEHTYFGDRAVRFDGSGHDLFRHWALTWLLLLPTLGLAWFWYDARAKRYLAAHTTFDDLRFAFPVTGMQICRRSSGDLLLVVLTLGLGTPLVVLRRMRFLARHLTITGAADFAAIAQGSAPAPATGEGWLDLFDLGAV